MSRICAIHCHVNNGSDMMAFLIWNSKTLHQFCVSGSNRDPIDLCSHTVSADLFNIGHAAAVDRLAVRFLQALADRMGGSALC